MISRIERRILAVILAVMMFVTTGYAGCVTVNAADFEESQIMKISAGVKNDTEIKQADDMAMYRFVPQETGTYHFYSIESGDTQ